MTAPQASEAAVSGIIGTVARETGRALDPGSFRWIERPDFKEDVADATLAVHVPGARRGEDVVVLVSGEGFPEAVAEAVGKLADVSGRLDPKAARHILTPLCSGRHDGRSFAAFPFMRAMSEGRLVRYLEKRLSAGHIVSWLVEVARQTRTPCAAADVDHLFTRPLQAVAGDPDMTDGLRRAAEACLDMVAKTPGDLFTVAEHGDFWMGNILYRWSRPALLAPARGDFVVIDWRGSRLDGYPCADLIRYCLSTRRPGSARSRADLGSYRAALGIGPQRAGIYGMAAIGRVGLNRGEFPKDRYVALAGQIHCFLAAHGLAG